MHLTLSMSAAALLQPLDVITTTQQGQQLAREAVVSGVTAANPRLGVFSTAKLLVQSEGPLALFKGLSATIVRVFFGAGLYFVSLHAITERLGKGSSHGGIKSFIAGAAARSLSAAVLSPVAVVKTRMEWAAMGTSPYKGTVHALRSIAAKEGMASLYSGLLPTIVRDAPFSGLYFAFYTHLRQWWTERSHGQGEGQATVLPSTAVNFTCGLLAGAGATLFTHPADVVKTRLQIRDARGRFVDGTVLVAEVRSLVAREGPHALMVGLGARVSKRAAQTALTWTLFEELLGRLGIKSGGTGGGA